MIIGRDGYIGRMLEDSEDAVIWMGWPSSVKAANRDPRLTWRSIDDFAKLVQDLPNDKKLIYASSCSVYDAIPGEQNEECNTFNLKNWYDFAKRTMDSIALLSGKQIYGLRFATVNGWSPCLRVDVMMNKMVKDARDKGVVTISNPQLTRPVLGMQDLVRAVKAITDSKEDKRGIYNLASFAYSVEEYGRLVAKKYNAKLEILPGDPAYAWGVNTGKFKKAYNFEFRDTPQSVIDSLAKPVEQEVERL